MSKRTSAFFVDPLYSRMADDLHLGGMSQRTHDGYLRAVRQLSDYCQTPPDEITEDQLRRYFLHLKNEKQFAYGSLRVAYSGIKFFYTRTCKRDWQTLAQMKLQNVKSLPEVITIKQVHQIIDACTTARMAVYFWTVYSLGLRMQEGLNLQVGDIDADRGLVHVHRGKGAKDRDQPGIHAGRCPSTANLHARPAAQVLGHPSPLPLPVSRRRARSPAGGGRQDDDESHGRPGRDEEDHR